MKLKWNGWGVIAAEYPLNTSSRKFLHEKVGKAVAPVDADFTELLAKVPASRLPGHRLVSQNPQERLLHARGQSLPDWIALRSGRIGALPDGVAFPQSTADIRELLDYALLNGIQVIPYGGGTSVAGHINPLDTATPVLTIDMRRMNRLILLDENSQTATFEAGVTGPVLEAELRARGYTLGHFPQSFELSTLGGWVTTRSSGQQSLGYGRIEKLFAGGKLETCHGTLTLPHFPASAAGPDIKELIMGSEGRYGILTEAIVRIRKLPEKEDFLAMFFPDFSSGVKAVKALSRSRLPLTMLRLSTSEETMAALAMAGHEKLIVWLERYLKLRGVGEGKCLLIYGAAGSRKETSFAVSGVKSIGRSFDGVCVGRRFGSEWHKNRFKTPYLRNTLWGEGYAIDTFETAVPWLRVEELIRELHQEIAVGLVESGEKVQVHTHLSHFYTDGCSVYTTYAYRLSQDHEVNLSRWRMLKGIASDLIAAHGGTISHQHGVGIDHKPWLAAEKGETGMELLQAAGRVMDPEQLFNQGKLF